jgi:hypothetical protein
MSIVDGNQGGVVEGLKRSNATPQTIGTLQAGRPTIESDFSIVTSQNIRGFSSQNVISPTPEPAKIEVQPLQPLKPEALQPGQTQKSRDPRLP